MKRINIPRIAREADNVTHLCHALDLTWDRIANQIEEGGQAAARFRAMDTSRLVCDDHPTGYTLCAVEMLIELHRYAVEGYQNDSPVHLPVGPIPAKTAPERPRHGASA